MTIDTRLAEIRARVEAATEGPWQFQHWGGQNQNGDYAESILFDGTGETIVYGLSDADGEWIAPARTDLPALLAAVEAIDRLIRPWEASEVEAHSPGAGFHAALQFAAHHVRHALTAALETQDTTREDQTHD